MENELDLLRSAGISVFAVAVSDRADELEVRVISSAPQVANINYFLSPTITNLNSLSSPLATQVSLRRVYVLLLFHLSFYSCRNV